ncbi:MAG: phosphatidylserine decarboxylase family protein, partial [Planctomycetes bacterium]|nr:phosphatidylserine decarboxylase family protein [Planctomycetota bacterium]
MAAALLAWFFPWWSVLPVLVIWVAVVSFFRDPIRTIPQNLPSGVMLSPADGAVSAVEQVDHHEATDGPATIVRIFLSVLNVHVNRAPCDAEVVALEYTPGKFLNAQTEESARVNESNLTTLRIAGGETIGLRQVSG